MTKIYNEFSHIERVNLILAAIVRGDMKEAKTLQQTCPTKHYVAVDLNYRCLMRNLERVMNHFVLTYTSLCGRLQLAIIGKFSYLLMQHYEEDKLLATGKIKNNKFRKHLIEFSDLTDICEKRERRYTIELKALHDGFKAFCNEVGIDYENALTCIMQSNVIKNPPNLQEYDKKVVNLQPNADIEKTKNKFLELWN
jgi:hypothetical protein